MVQLNSATHQLSNATRKSTNIKMPPKKTPGEKPAKGNVTTTASQNDPATTDQASTQLARPVPEFTPRVIPTTNPDLTEYIKLLRGAENSALGRISQLPVFVLTHPPHTVILIANQAPCNESPPEQHLQTSNSKGRPSILPLICSWSDPRHRAYRRRGMSALYQRQRALYGVRNSSERIQRCMLQLQLWFWFEQMQFFRGSRYV